jgi:hypothetical protein
MLLTGCAGDLPLPYEVRTLLREIEPLLQAARGVFALAGLALLVAGYKIYRFVIALPGFLIGALLGAVLGYGSAESWLLAILGLVLGGLAGAALALLLHDLAVFLLGALIGGALAGIVFAGFGDSGPPILAMIIGGIIGGAGLLALSHMWVVLLSSIVGAVLFGFGIGAGPGWMILFCLGGIGVQYGLARALGDKLPLPGAEAEPAEKAVAPASSAEPRPAVEYRPAAEPYPEVAPVEVEPPPAPAEAVAVVSPPPEQAPASPAATLVSLGAGGEMFRVTDGCLVGRGSACDVWLRDRAVSRKHARFRYAQGAWFLQDEGSTVGTFVNGQKVMATRLSAGDRIQFGTVAFTFQPGGSQ